MRLKGCVRRTLQKTDFSFTPRTLSTQKELRVHSEIALEAQKRRQERIRNRLPPDHSSHTPASKLGGKPATGVVLPGHPIVLTQQFSLPASVISRSLRRTAESLLNDGADAWEGLGMRVRQRYSPEQAQTHRGSQQQN